MWVPRNTPLRLTGVKNFRTDRRGAVAVIAAIALPVLVGMLGLAVDVSIWSGNKNSAQGAADNAALSAVAAVKGGANATQATNEALAVAALNGFQNGANGVTVTVNNPPATGSYASNSKAYEVIVQQQQKLFFGRMLGNAITVQGRSVALGATASGPCVLALETSASKAIDMSGGSTIINAPTCDVIANSTASTAANLSGGASIIASKFKVGGNYATSGSSAVTATITTGAAATADPYASLVTPTPSSCLKTGYSLSGGTDTLNPGTYCNGISVSGGGVLNLNPGVYIINGGGLTVSSSTLKGTGGVSIVITNASASWGIFTISGGSTFNVTAPSSGVMQGVALYMDRAAPISNSNVMSGGSNQIITGTIYVPTGKVTYSGGSGGGSGCLQLIARLLLFSGGSSFGQSCGSLVVPGFQSGGKAGVPVE